MGTMLEERLAVKIDHKPVTIVNGGYAVNLHWKQDRLILAFREPGSQGDPEIGGVIYAWHVFPPAVRVRFAQGQLILMIRNHEGKYIEQLRRPIQCALDGFADEITVRWNGD